MTVPAPEGAAAPRPWRARLLSLAVYATIAAVVVGAALAIQHAGLGLPEDPPPSAAPAVTAPPVAIDATVTGGEHDGDGGARGGDGGGADEATGGGSSAGTGATTGAPASAPLTERVDPAWVDEMAAATGIPRRALLAYAAAQLAIDAERPECGVGWNTLAAIGSIESDHGRHGGATLLDSGYSEPRILGVPLNGDGVMAIPDTDGGAWDGDTVWDRAVGPMQFIPETWSRWGVDADGDGQADPNQIDDAAFAAARYLCASGEVTSVDGWRGAVFSYNNLESYVDSVAATANEYARRAENAG